MKRDYTHIIYLFSLIAILTGCTMKSAGEHNNSSEDTCIVSQDSIDHFIPYIDFQTLSSDILGVDSIIEYSYIGAINNTKILFRIAKGGNIECISDTLLYLDNRPLWTFTIADYSQTDQLFYVVYEIDVDSIYQTERVNLPYIGKTISDHKKLELVNVSNADLFSIKSLDPDTIIDIDKMPLDCDESGIINYYEYQ